MGDEKLGWKLDPALYEDSRFDGEERSNLEAIKRMELKDGGHVLKLGCGPGLTALHMARLIPNGKFLR